MNRWRPIASRVLLIVVLCSIVLLRWNELVGGRIVSWCESFTSRRVSIGSVESEQAKLYLRDVDLYHRDKENVCVHADEIALKLNKKALSDRRLVMDSCQITGLQATLDEPNGRELSIEDYSSRGEDWFLQISDRLNSDTADLDSTRLINQLTEQWQQQIKTHRQNGNLVEPQDPESKHATSHNLENPLRRDRTDSRSQDRIDSILLEIDRQRRIVSAITAQVEQDEQTIETVICRDVQRLSKRFDLKPIDIEDFDEFLCAKQKSRLVQQLVNWIDWGQRIAEQIENEVSTNCMRGENILLKKSAKPDLLCEELIIDGTLNLTNQSFPFHAELFGLTTQPDKRDCPLKMRVHLPKQQADAVFVIDYSQKVCHQKITVVQQLAPKDQEVLGREGVFTATMTPVELSAKTEVELYGNVWCGDITLDGQAKLALDFSEQIAGTSNSIEKTQESQAVQLAVKFVGTTRSPKCELHTNLGRQLAPPIHAVLRRRFNQRRGEVTTKLKSRAQQLVARIQSSAEEIKEAASRKIQFAENKLATLKYQIANQDPLRTPLR